jgi:hypothetical protein
MNLLVDVQRDLGHHREAQELRERTPAMRRVKLGREHPDTIRTMRNPANSHDFSRRYEDAIRLGEASTSAGRGQRPIPTPERSPAWRIGGWDTSRRPTTPRVA